MKPAFKPPQTLPTRPRDDTPYQEAMLIGMLLKAPQQLHDADAVEPDDLASLDYRIHLESLRFLDLARNGITEADLPAVIEVIALKLRITEADTAAMVHALREQVFSTANLLDFSLKVKRAALERRIDAAMLARDPRKVRDLVNEQESLREKHVLKSITSRLIRLSAMGDRPPAVDWLIRGYLERDTVTQLFGDPGSGKSFVALDMALSIATGKDWYGYATQRGPVIYLAGEGTRGMQRRKEAWLRHHAIEDRSAPFWLSATATPLSDPAQHTALVTDIHAVITAAGESLPLLIVVDTLARNFGPGDENSTKDMSAFIAALDGLRERYHCCILLIHHSGHADKSRARGAMALLGSLDAEYRIEKLGDDTLTLTSTKQKDNDPPPPLAWTLARYDLPWADDYGQPINSAVLVPNDADTTIGKQVKPVVQESGQHKQALDVLRERYRQQRQNLEDAGHDPARARVSMEDWEEAMQGITENRFYRSRLRKNLLDRGKVRFEGGFVTLADDKILTAE